MIFNKIMYTLYGKTTSEEPALVQAKPAETVQGSVNFTVPMSIYTGTLRAAQAPTGTTAYTQYGQDFFATAVAYTGVGAQCSFVVDLASINAPTGAQSGELYAMQLHAGYTGIPGLKAVADIVIQVKSELL